MAFLDLLCRTLAKRGLIPPGVIKIHVLQKTPRSQPVGHFLNALKLRLCSVGACDRASTEIHTDANARRIHDSNCPCDSFLGSIDVHMEIDDPVFGAPLIRQCRHILGAGQARHAQSSEASGSKRKKVQAKSVQGLRQSGVEVCKQFASRASISDRSCLGLG
jgi:hypothetical protein